jgi:2-haloacid dehalogenase
MIDFDKFDVLTFDCYGTLIDWESGILSALEPSFKRAGVARSDNVILEAYAALEAEAEAGEYLPYKEVLKTVLSGLGAQFGFSPPKGDLERFSTCVSEWPAFPDSADALTVLKGKYRLAVLSNIDLDLFASSARRLEVEFDYLFTAQEIGSYKPDKRNFEYALERLPFDRPRILHVAQSLFHDIGPARGCGLSTVWINRRHGKTGAGATPVADATPDAEFPDLRSFAEAACGRRGV